MPQDKYLFFSWNYVCVIYTLKLWFTFSNKWNGNIAQETLYFFILIFLNKENSQCYIARNLLSTLYSRIDLSTTTVLWRNIYNWEFGWQECEKSIFWTVLKTMILTNGTEIPLFFFFFFRARNKNVTVLLASLMTHE